MYIFFLQEILDIPQLLAMAVGKKNLHKSWSRLVHETAQVTCHTKNSVLFVDSAGEKILASNDVSDMLDELLEAKNESRLFGLSLKLPLHVVEAIHSTHSLPKERLLQVLIEFTRQIDPKPTWRVIADALRSPAVNLPRLAEKVEKAHFTDSTSTRNVVSATETGIIRFLLIHELVSPYFITSCSFTVRAHLEVITDLKKQLMEKESELNKTIRRDQLQIQELKQQVRYITNVCSYLHVFCLHILLL